MVVRVQPDDLGAAEGLRGAARVWAGPAVFGPNFGPVHRSTANLLEVSPDCHSFVTLSYCLPNTFLGLLVFW